MADYSKPKAATKSVATKSVTFDEVVKNMARSRARIANIDAEINGGALVEVANMLGKPLYMRVNHNDPELARHELAEMRSLVKDVVYPEYDYTPSEYTVEEYAHKQRVSKQTVWRWIKANKIVARRIGKSYRISA